MTSWNKLETQREPEKMENLEVSMVKWERQEQIWNELSNMYETELKRINEIKARQTQVVPKPNSIIKRKHQERMRRTGGGFRQIRIGR